MQYLSVIAVWLKYPAFSVKSLDWSRDRCSAARAKNRGAFSIDSLRRKQNICLRSNYLQNHLTWLGRSGTDGGVGFNFQRI
jgi:hypothetical protein